MKSFTVHGVVRTDKTIHEIAEEIQDLAHDYSSNPDKISMDAIMHLAADIILTQQHQEIQTL